MTPAPATPPHPPPPSPSPPTTTTRPTLPDRSALSKAAVMALTVSEHVSPIAAETCHHQRKRRGEERRSVTIY